MRPAGKGERRKCRFAGGSVGEWCSGPHLWEPADQRFLDPQLPLLEMQVLGPLLQTQAGSQKPCRGCSGTSILTSLPGALEHEAGRPVATEHRKVETFRLGCWFVACPHCWSPSAPFVSGVRVPGLLQQAAAHWGPSEPQFGGPGVRSKVSVGPHSFLQRL